MIHTQQLSYTYPNSQTTLQFADVQLAQGETLVLRGKSGSGKSTWLALLAGLLTMQMGELTVAGQRLNGMSNAARDAWRAQNLGFLPQRLHLSEALTVAGNLQLAYFAAGMQQTAKTQAHLMDTLQKLGIETLSKRKPSSLSGGQAQRVALARAVLLSPKIILADEPTASLDDDAAQDALALLCQSAQTCHATLVIATHDARVLQQLPNASILNLANFNDKIGLNTAYLLPKVLLNK
ncbi:MAG TPA: ATP-binding cassette domain-containing protein [Burkholderiaceae bacterium]|nr:ATP-binding cassette domain-containing protein [Burkholderiaceae bacterium]